MEPQPGGLSIASIPDGNQSSQTLSIPITTSTSPNPDRTPSQSSSKPAVSTTSNAPASTFNHESPPPSSSKASSSGVGTGAAIGGIIAAVVGGLLIGFVATFLFLRHRKRSHQHRRSKKRRGSEKQVPPSFSPTHDDSTPWKYAWESHLPQPVDDNALRLRLRTLFHQAELHVENFYTDTKSSTWAGSVVERELSAFDSGHLPAPLVTMMQQTRSKGTIIKHSLTHFILAKISTGSSSSASFLPMEYTALPAVVDGSNANLNKPGAKEALSHWRVTTAYLRSAPTLDPSYLSQRDSTISSAASAFSSAFAPWARATTKSPSTDTDTDTTRCQNLVEIMRAATDVGLLIFAQPSTFGYRWEVPPGAGGGGGGGGGGRAVAVVVAPAIVKLTDEHAAPLSQPQVLVQQTVDGV